MRLRDLGWIAALAATLLSAIVAADPAPAPWSGQDIGAVAHNGGVDYEDGVFKVNGSGSDVWGNADSCYLLAQPAGETCTVIAHFSKGLQYVDPWAKAGLMIRASADPAAPEAFLAVTSTHGLIFEFRSTPGGATVDYEIGGDYSTAAGGTGEWLKLTRDGDRLVASICGDGANWQPMGTADVPMGGSAIAGIAMSAHDPNQAYGFAWFDRVQLSQSVVPNPPGEAPPPTSQKARSADAFVNSIGVGAHDYPDTTYGQYATIIRPRLEELGIRHVRDGWDDRYVDLYHSFGIKLNMVASTPEQATRAIDAHPDVIDEIEGPNETDIMQWDDATHKVDRWFSYDGLTNSQGSYPATRADQQAIYDAVKNDPNAQAHHIGVEMPTMANPTDTANLAPLSAFDFETMHSYAGGLLPSNQLDTTWIPDTNEVEGNGAPHKPIIATECGYHTATQGSQPGVSDEAQGKYIPRLLCEYFNRGVVRTFTYEFADEHDNPNDQESCWGLIRYDGTPKPAYLAEKSLIALLSEDHWDSSAQRWVGPKFTPGSLKFAIGGANGVYSARNATLSSAGDPSPLFVHHALLEKSTGVFYLLLWQDVYSYDTDARRDIDNPDVPVRLIFGQPIKSLSLFRLGADTGAPESIPVTRGEAIVPVPDEVVIAKITPAAAG